MKSQANPYAMDSFPGFEVAASAPVDARVGFIRKTYLHVFGAVMALIALETVLFTLVPMDALYKTMFGTPYMNLIFLVGFMALTWLGHSMTNNRANPGVAYAGLGLIVAAYGVMLLPLLAVANHIGGPQLIASAAGATGLIFGGLTATVFVTKKDFSFMRGALTLGMLAAFAAIGVGFFTGWSSAFNLIFVVGMVLLAGGYVLYDTSNILHKYAVDQHVAASAALFASLAMLFFYVLRLAMIIASSRD